MKERKVLYLTKSIQENALHFDFISHKSVIYIQWSISVDHMTNSNQKQK